MMVKQLRNVYQIKVTLVGSKPPIWRRLLVPSTMALDDLHLALQIAVGWTDSHLHQFVVDGVFYGVPDLEFDCRDESKAKLDKLLLTEKDFIIYEYDFGDGWEHKIILEKILPLTKEIQLPFCKGGKHACPPEDIGGIWGYYDFLEAVNDPDHPDYEDMLELVGDDEFDPEYLDLDEVNALLLEYCR